MREIAVRELELNPFTIFEKDWMLLTAGNGQEGYNTMTVGWGQLGSVWETGHRWQFVPTVVCYVYPSRYTKEFMDRESLFTLCHFPKSCRKALAYLGCHSGRDEDKVKKAGLTPVFAEGTTYFAEADLVFVCRKIYTGNLNREGFADRTLLEFNYPEGDDLHEMYIGEIQKVLKKD